MIHEHDRETDRRTPRDGYSHAYAQHRAAKIEMKNLNMGSGAPCKTLAKIFASVTNPAGL